MIVKNINDDKLVCRIELTLEEVKAISYSLSRTMCNGDNLTISMQLEEKLDKLLNEKNDN